MDILELIRNADSAAQVLSLVGAYLQSLPEAASIPQWCLRAPLEGEADVTRRMGALFVAVNVASRNLLDHDCRIAKHALRVVGAAAARLRRRRQRN
jgi:hypothetical protein